MSGQRFCVDKNELQQLIEKYPGMKKRILERVELGGKEFNSKPNLFIIKDGRQWIEEIKTPIQFYDSNIPFEEQQKKEETPKEESPIKIEKVDIDSIANKLLSQYSFVTIYGSKSEDIFVKENNIWVSGGREVIQTEVEKKLGNDCTNNIVREVEGKIKRKTSTPKEKFEKIIPELICVENGILNLVTKKLVDTPKDIYFKTKIPIIFNPNAKCPKIMKFIEDTFYPEDIHVFQEWSGFCLYREYLIKKGVILVGIKDTGKTIAINLLTTFVGEKNTSGINLHRISSGDKFGIAALKDKFLNTFDDLSAKDLADSGGFKVATGGGYITAEYKFGDSFQFKNYAKHIFATNKIPPIKDTNDDAYYDRWLAIPTDNSCPKEKQDAFLLKKLTTPEELSGFLNWALDGLERLLKQKRFSYTKNSEQTKHLMERSSHPLAIFVQDVLEQDNGNRISKQIMFEVYSRYCQDNGLPRLSRYQLSQQLEQYANFLIAKHDKERFWENVKIKSKYGGVL